MSVEAAGQPGGVKTPVRTSIRGLIREMIFGINDGMVSTIGLVSGETLSHQSHAATLIATVSAAGAATVSMAVGSYLSSSAANDLLRKEIREKVTDIENHPEEQRKQVHLLLGAIGVPHHVIPATTESIVSNKRRWIRFMVREGLGIQDQHMESAVMNAFAMGIAVIVGTLPAIVPFFFPLPMTTARNLAWGLSLAASYLLGFLKGSWTHDRPWLSGLQFCALTGLSAGVGALIGYFIGRLHV